MRPRHKAAENFRSVSVMMAFVIGFNEAAA